MGGGFYDRDVETTSSSDWYSNSAEIAMSTNHLSINLNPKGKTLNCINKNPVVVAMDVTRSRGNDSKIIYDKMPMLFGQIKIQNYLEDPAISFAAIGDATCDNAPIQVSDFASGTEIDQWLTKIWLEEGGGGTGQESYELMAFFYANHCNLTNLESGKKGLFFFTGDEGFYSNADGKYISNLIGDKNKSINTEEIFRKLQKKFDVFFLFPKKKMEDRKSDIDAEIAKRLKREGAKSGDVCVSLIWNNRNDLDLHVITPSGEEIFFGHRKSLCGGELDVDMNVNGESMEPVENIYWPAGSAPIGQYKVYVQNFAYHGGFSGTTNFKVAITINGEVTQYEGKITGTKAESNVTVAKFRYKGKKEKEEKDNSVKDAYENYSDEKIISQWKSVIPSENIILLEEPKSVVDVMLGIISITSGTRDIDSYIVDMTNRGQTSERIENVKLALNQFSTAIVPVSNISLAKIEKDSKSKKRKSNIKRLK